VIPEYVVWLSPPESPRKLALEVVNIEEETKYPEAFFFFRENAKELSFHFIEQEDIRGTTSQEEGHPPPPTYT
jgi:hypothetical protein